MNRQAMNRTVLIVAAVALAACSSEGPPNPIPMETPEVADPVEAGQKVRTVETRNPFSARSGNLLVDGDFEFSTNVQGRSSQSGWLAFGGYLRAETGGTCRSGLRCGVLGPGMQIYGQGAAARNTGMIVSMWAKPPAGQGCGVLDARLIHCNFSQAAARLFPETDAPGADGWCFYRARSARQSTGTCMLVESTLDEGTILVDDAAVIPDDGTAPLSLGTDGKPSRQAIPDTVFEPVHGSYKERLQEIVEARRRRMRIGKPLDRRPEMPRH